MDEFPKLLEQHIPRLRSYARSLHRSDRSRADDLVQDTLARALAKQHLWKSGTNLLNWLFTLMHNQYVNDVRRSVARAAFSNTLSDNVASVNDTSSSLLFRDLKRAMVSLSHERREAVLLVALEGMSYEAVAKRVGIPIGTVRSRVARGRRMLRKMMDITGPLSEFSV